MLRVPFGFEDGKCKEMLCQRNLANNSAATGLAVVISFTVKYLLYVLTLY